MLSSPEKINYVYTIGLENFYQDPSSDKRYLEYLPTYDNNNAIKGVTISIKDASNSSKVEYFTLYSNNAKINFDKSFVGYKLYQTDIPNNWNNYD